MWVEDNICKEINTKWQLITILKVDVDKRRRGVWSNPLYNGNLTSGLKELHRSVYSKYYGMTVSNTSIARMGQRFRWIERRRIINVCSSKGCRRAQQNTSFRLLWKNRDVMEYNFWGYNGSRPWPLRYIFRYSACTWFPVHLSFFISKYPKENLTI